MKKTINDKMYKLAQSPIPFFQVEYVNRDGNEDTGIFLVDSSIDVNFVNEDVYAACSKTDGADGELVELGKDLVLRKGHFSFSMDGVECDEEFFIKSIPFHGYEGDIPIIGVVGYKFLRIHELAIDYTNKTIHLSDFAYNGGDITDCEFFFPMAYGLKNYGTPTVSVGQGDLEIVAYVDTGNVYNRISASVIRDDGFLCENEDYEGLALYLSHYIESLIVSMDFNLLTVVDNEGHTAELLFKDDFEVSPTNFYDPEDGELDDVGRPLEPVEATIGAAFMYQEGWILDFGADAIYKYKKSLPNRQLAS